MCCGTAVLEAAKQRVNAKLKSGSDESGVEESPLESGILWPFFKDYF